MEKFKKACLDIFKEIKKQKVKDQKRINLIKNKVSKKYKLNKIPTNLEIASFLTEKQRQKYKHLLTIKPTRTISGVAVVAVMTKPIKCPHGKCAMCPGGPGSEFGSVPQSYTGKEPATRRAIRNKYDPYLQVFNRLEQYAAMNKDFDKIELIIMGGTFPSFQKKYQNTFITCCFKAMNDFSKHFFNKKRLDIKKFNKFFELPGDINNKQRTKRVQDRILKLKNKTKKNLHSEQTKNEKAKVRCVGLTIETRPDYAKLKHAKQMLKLGATRVELGVQTIFDDILEKIKRGHTVADSIKATRTLKDLGFKINYHMMPGLPGMNYKKDLFQLITIFENEFFQPDMLKIYPCMVLKGTKLYKLWKKKKFKPLTTKQAAKLIAEFKRYVPEYCRIMRVQRDIPTFMTEAGVDMTNLRQHIEQKIKPKCRCIRCREIGRYKGKEKIKKQDIDIIQTHYLASKGNEFFISAEWNDYLLGFCRLRFPSSQLRKEITEESALIRELHVFGSAVGIGKKSKGKGLIQHIGIGKMLLKEAEKTCKDYYKKKIIVISGIGAREYYRKLGYKKEGVYMVKSIK